MGGEGTGTLNVLVSDQEGDIADFESVKVTFSSVRVFPADFNASGAETDGEEGSDFFTQDVDYTVDLTQVVGEKAVSLTKYNVTAGEYNKVELYVDSVEATLTDGTQTTVTIPSNKLMLTKGFTVVEGEETTFVFDIQIVKRGQNNEYNLRPVIDASGEVGRDLSENEVDDISDKAMAGDAMERMPDEIGSGGTSAMMVPSGTFNLLVSDKEADIADFSYLGVTLDSARVFMAGGGTDMEDGSDMMDDNTTDDMEGNESMDDMGDGGSMGYTEIPIDYTVDLTQVVGDKAVSVVTFDLQAGKYTKIELYVASTNSTLVEGGEAQVTVPSNKLMLTRTFTVEPDEETKFVFDIQVARKGQGNEYNLRPVISKSGQIGKDSEVEDVEEIEDDEMEMGDSEDMGDNMGNESMSNETDNGMNNQTGNQTA